MTGTPLPDGPTSGDGGATWRRSAASARLQSLAARLLGTSGALVLLGDAAAAVSDDTDPAPSGEAGPPAARAAATAATPARAATTAATPAPRAATTALTQSLRTSAPVLLPSTSDPLAPAVLAVPVPALTAPEAPAGGGAPDAGAPVGAVCVWDTAPREWSAEDVRLLTDLATSVAAEVTLARVGSALEVSAARTRLALDAAGIGSFDLDLRTGRLVWDARMLEMYGCTAEDFSGTVEEFNARVHPDDLPRMLEVVDQAVADLTGFTHEHRVVLPDGRLRWVQTRGRAFAGADGAPERLIGAGYDTTALREGDAAVARVLETLPAAFYRIDPSERFGYLNARAEELLGRSREVLLGTSVWEAFPEAAGTEFEARYRAAVATGVPQTFEAYYPAPLDRWYELVGWPGPDGVSVYFHDITDRRAAQVALQRAADRSALLAEVASGLSGTLDAEEAVARLARIVVPTLARWSIITLVGDGADGAGGRRLRDVGWSHEDPEMLPTVTEYAQLRLPALTEAGPVMQALRTAQPSLVATDGTEAIARVLADPAPLPALRRLAPSDVVAIPLVAGGRTLGLMTLYDSALGRSGAVDLEDDDWTTALDVAGRAALALDNARLYALQRRVAERLQRSLLSKAPQPRDLEIAVRYQPAAEAAWVGGDWHDAFRPRAGVTTVVIGDVVGHDLAAAAAMGQVRALLRGIAVTTGEGPAAVLDRLDAVLEVLEVTLVATAVVAEIERTPEDVAAGGARLRWCSAGHPPPMVVTPDGAVRDLSEGVTTPPDLLLGVDRAFRRHEHEAYLEAGSTLLLYTDGLVERRRERYKVGLDRLRVVLAGLADRDLEDLCDTVLATLLPELPGDDVALAAVRIR